MAPQKRVRVGALEGKRAHAPHRMRLRGRRSSSLPRQDDRRRAMRGHKRRSHVLVDVPQMEQALKVCASGTLNRTNNADEARDQLRFQRDVLAWYPRIRQFIIEEMVLRGRYPVMRYVG